MIGARDRSALRECCFRLVAVVYVAVRETPAADETRQRELRTT